MVPMSHNFIGDVLLEAPNMMTHCFQKLIGLRAQTRVYWSPKKGCGKPLKVRFWMYFAILNTVAGLKIAKNYCGSYYKNCQVWLSGTVEHQVQDWQGQRWELHVKTGWQESHAVVQVMSLHCQIQGVVWCDARNIKFYRGIHVDKWPERT